VPASFLAFDCYDFAVRLNPTKRDKQSGKIIPVGVSHTPIEKKMALRDWFCHKSGAWGIQADAERLQIQYSLQAFDKRERTVTQSVAVFNGIVRVIDRALFIKSFEDGIGRGKSFGFGLLELIPLQEK
jgi:CRISPR system Cascade subunit CasE